MEDTLIDRVRQIIIDHLDDEKFGVTHLASEIGWSRSHTFRKGKSVSNKSFAVLYFDDYIQIFNGFVMGLLKV